MITKEWGTRMFVSVTAKKFCYYIRKNVCHVGRQIIICRTVNVRTRYVLVVVAASGIGQRVIYISILLICFFYLFYHIWLILSYFTILLFDYLHISINLFVIYLFIYLITLVFNVWSLTFIRDYIFVCVCVYVYICIYN